MKIVAKQCQRCGRWRIGRRCAFCKRQRRQAAKQGGSGQ